MTDDDKKLSFYIDAYSPETIPTAKLALYMADFAALLGKEHAVHFDHLEGGSTKIVSRVECEDVPKVTTRFTDIRTGPPRRNWRGLWRRSTTGLPTTTPSGASCSSRASAGRPPNYWLFPAGTGPRPRATARSIRRAILTAC